MAYRNSMQGRATARSTTPSSAPAAPAPVYMGTLLPGVQQTATGPVVKVKQARPSRGWYGQTADVVCLPLGNNFFEADRQRVRALAAVNMPSDERDRVYEQSTANGAVSYHLQQ